ncbi:hypothetical protein PPL_00725 [Heterostelium album PN500]|uniref:Protein kinase domain-containing protein n=1 Tax=Heterostelium pallidum (strain ATCC 26659 / Pp 5 / PN500) TaxID=670386 RepID=D3AX94_HETP5|nr:hypothetical protein PPL_00725 [Heterostelium album PN500]EFA86163.1 hypothetical protein PPL_00725 [Heterostelium album PN500]|eukprot:XP_020438268.1 hypothetical protein PPL_00725 [Heterostelium album PN500]
MAMFGGIYTSLDGYLQCRVDPARSTGRKVVITINIKNDSSLDLFVIISDDGVQGYNCPRFTQLRHTPAHESLSIELADRHYPLSISILEASNNQYQFEPISLPLQSYSLVISPNFPTASYTPRTIYETLPKKKITFTLSNVTFYLVSKLPDPDNNNNNQTLIKKYIVLNDKTNELNIYTQYNYEKSPSTERRASNEIASLLALSGSNIQLLKLLFYDHNKKKSNYSTITEFGNKNIYHLCELYQRNNDYIPEEVILSFLQKLLNYQRELESKHIAHCNIDGSNVFVKDGPNLVLSNFEYSVFTSKNNVTDSSFNLVSEGYDNTGDDKNNNNVTMKVKDGKCDILGIGMVILLLLSCHKEDLNNFTTYLNDKNNIMISSERYSQELIRYVKENLLCATPTDIDTLQTLLDEHIRKQQFTIIYNKPTPFRFDNKCRITVLEFGDQFNQELVELPTTLQSINLGNSFNQHIKPNTLPRGLKSVVFGNNYNQPLEVEILPASVTSIKFGKEFNQLLPVGVLPVELKQLTFGDNFNQPLKPHELPSKLENLEFGKSFDKSIQADTLPDSLLALTFGEYFNQPLPEVPKNLVKLEVGSKFTQEIEITKLPECITTLKGVGGKKEWVRIPDSVTSLTFGRHFNQPILKGMLPKSLVYLEFGSDFNNTIHPDSWPDGLEVLVFGNSFNQPIELLPSKMSFLTFGNSFNQPISTKVLPNIQYLSFGLGYDHPIPPLPTSLYVLHLDDGYRHQIQSSILPPNLTSLTIGSKEHIDYIQALKKNNISYHFPDRSDQHFTILQLKCDQETTPGSEEYTFVNKTNEDLIIYLRSKNKDKQDRLSNHFIHKLNSPPELKSRNIIKLKSNDYISISQIIIMKFTNRTLISKILDFSEVGPGQFTFSIADSFTFLSHDQKPLMFPVNHILNPKELQHLTKELPVNLDDKSYHNVFTFRNGANTSHLLMDGETHELFVCKYINRNIQNEIYALQSVRGKKNFVQYVTHVYDPLNKKVLLLTKYCNGGDLSLIKESIINWNENNPQQLYYFPEDTLFSYAKQLGKCVEELSKIKGVIIHCDIKLANIFLENNLLVLADMGCCKCLDPIKLANLIPDGADLASLDSEMEKETITDSSAATVTSQEPEELPTILEINDKRNIENQCVELVSRGTDGYRAPETQNIDKEKRTYSIASDLFSIGSVLHNLSTLHPKDRQYRKQFISTKYKEVHISDNRYSQHFIIIVRTLLSVDPKERGSLPTFQNTIALGQMSYLIN